jgi:hypothetical protein
MDCNLTAGPIEISSGSITCDGTSSQLSDLSVSLTGDGRFPLTIINTTSLTLKLTDLSISSPLPIEITDSSINIVLQGANSIRGQDAAIACNDGSSLSFSGDGHLTATSQSELAIGALKGTCNLLEFENGTYEVTGGIGAGPAGLNTKVAVTSLLISGGDFTVTSTSGSGSGIGSGTVAGGGESRVDTLSISGGKFTVTSFTGAGIGAGSSYGGTSSVGVLNISGGTLTSIVGSYYSAGIGSGNAKGGLSHVDLLSISDAWVSAYGWYGAGIGSGRGDGGLSSVGTLRIASGDITASASEFGAAIGAGRGYRSTSQVESLEIEGGTITARAMSGAAIGAGDAVWGFSTVGRIAISGGQISARTDLGAGAGVCAGTGTRSSRRRPTARPRLRSGRLT